MTKRSIGLLYGILLLNIACPTWQNTEVQNSQVVLTVLRGVKITTDRVHVCSAKLGLKALSRYVESETMECSENKNGLCPDNSKLTGIICRCKERSPNYIVSQRKCVSNAWLRQSKS